jgi:glutamate synthase (NADPH/NADH) small chain
MLKFVQIPRAMPDKRPVAQRQLDFDEIYQKFSQVKAQEQATRCSQCGVPFCQNQCPLYNNIPDWLYLAAKGELQEAYQLSAQTSTMPEICGRICPQDQLCEGSCVEEISGHGTITIGAIENFLTETAWAEGWVAPLSAKEEKNLSVGIVGSGPAGLAAAERLREQGWQVTVYERNDRAGGLLVYGIPGFKLDKSVVARRVARLQAGGVQFSLNTEIGLGLSVKELRAKHDAILLACGVYKARDLGFAEAKNEAVMQALPYLTQSNRRGFESTATAPVAKDKHVVVIGGGDTAMDCVRTAIREQAKTVTCLYRRDQTNMPGSVRETQNAMDEGVHFEWLASPIRLQIDAGVLTSVQAIRMRLGEPDRAGRQIVIPVPESEFALPADLVIQALGFEPEDLGNFWPKLKTRTNGTVNISSSDFSTNLPGVFAAGDIVRGASLVVWAIRQGQDAAAQMDQYLSARLHRKKKNIKP